MSLPDCSVWATRPQHSRGGSPRRLGSLGELSIPAYFLSVLCSCTASLLPLLPAGSTNPLASAPGTIRGDLAVDMGRNIIHGSDSVDSAMREIALWFRSDELAEYDPVATTWIYE